MDISRATSLTAQIVNNETPEVTFRYFSDYVSASIHEMQTGGRITGKKKYYSDATIRQYKMFSDWWREFEATTGRAYEFPHIMPKLVAQFELFLTKNGLSLNSVSAVLAKLKALLKTAFLDGIHFWNGSGVKCPHELTTKIYLSISDLRRLTNNETPISETQQKVLDIFLVQCFTGLRYDTLQKFLAQPFGYIKSHEGKNYLDIVSDKTGEQSVIPIGETVKGIIAKYSGAMPRVSEVYLNREIKNVAKLRGLTEETVIRKTIGGESVEEFKPKWRQVSSHTARRTFISLLKLTDISDREICSMTGHTTEKQMQVYARITNLDKVKGVLGHDFFDTAI